MSKNEAKRKNNVYERMFAFSVYKSEEFEKYSV